jgi:hypothetical protein
MEAAYSNSILYVGGLTTLSVWMLYSSGIENYLFAYLPDAISLHLCTPKAVGV